MLSIYQACVTDKTDEMLMKIWFCCTAIHSRNLGHN